MYTYIYDADLTDKRYLNSLSKLEGKLTDAGLSGRICRLSPLRNIRDVVNDELRRAPDTLVVVGGDNLLTQVISYAQGSQLPLGVVPLGESVKLATSFGINEDNAPQVLAARRIIEVDSGLINGRFFLKKALIGGEQLKFVIDGNYQVSVEKGDIAEVVNFLDDDEECCLPERPHPQSQKICLVISRRDNGFLSKNKLIDQTMINCRELSISGESLTACLDGSVEVRQVSQAVVCPAAFKMIVGKQRNF